MCVLPTGRAVIPHRSAEVRAARVPDAEYCGQIAKLAERRCRSRRLPEPPSVIPDDAIMRRQPLENRQPYRRVAPTRMQENQRRTIAARIVGPKMPALNRHTHPGHARAGAAAKVVEGHRPIENITRILSASRPHVGLVCSSGDELLPTVDVVRRAGERRIAHDVDGKRGDVGGPDDAADRERRSQLIPALVELISEQ